MILSSFRGPGAHFASLGTHFENISDFCDFEDASGAKKQVTFETLFRHFLTIFAFLCASFFCMNSGMGSRSVFSWMLDDVEELLGGFFDHFSGRSANTKKCVWTAQACADCISSFPENALFRNFFHPYFRSPAREAMLARFWCFWNSHGLHFGGRGCTKMRSEKKMQKVFKKGSATHASKGLWAP